MPKSNRGQSYTRAHELGQMSLLDLTAIAVGYVKGQQNLHVNIPTMSKDQLIAFILKQEGV